VHIGVDAGAWVVLVEEVPPPIMLKNAVRVVHPPDGGARVIPRPVRVVAQNLASDSCPGDVLRGHGPSAVDRCRRKAVGG
jgi:hypothetical protein